MAKWWRSGSVAPICELLSKAVVRDWARHVGAEPENSGQAIAAKLSGIDSSDAQRILGYLALVGSAGMPAIRETLGLSKMRAYRTIHALITHGRVVARGRSHQTTHALSIAETDKMHAN